MPAPITIPVRPLTPEAFAPYGAVLAPEAAPDRWLINDGAVMRHHALTRVEVTGAPAIVSIFEALRPAACPYSVDLVERHPYGLQAFMPLAGQELIVVVAAPGDAHAHELVAFACGGAGVSFAPGTWHAPLIAPDGGSYLIVDRDDTHSNCDVVRLEVPRLVTWV